MTFDAHEIGQCTFETANKMVDGLMVRYHIIRTVPGTGFGLHYDLELDFPGHVALEPGSTLINQAETRARIGRPAGFLPEERLMAQMPDCLGIIPSNFWQTGTFLLHASSEGGLNPFAGVYPEGNFTALVKMPNGWEAVALKFRDGAPDKASRRTINAAELGFSVPLILRDGRVRSLSEYADDPRVLGDLRNFVDFGCGRMDLPSRFWLLLRKVLPGSAHALKCLLSTMDYVETRPNSAMTTAEVGEFAATIKHYDLSKLKIERTGNEIHFTIQGPLPIQRIPIVGIGFNADHQLIVVVAEGRQKHSAGVSSEQLALLMKDEGAITAGLGAAGGDAGVWANIGGEFRMLSSGSYRPAPCLLIMG